jgi:hypothetical protein
MHTPNPKTYRMWLGEDVNKALVQLAEKKNSEGFGDLSITDYVEKMVEHWWKNEFPDKPVPFKTKQYYKDIDFVQSA